MVVTKLWFRKRRSEEARKKKTQVANKNAKLRQDVINVRSQLGGTRKKKAQIANKNAKLRQDVKIIRSQLEGEKRKKLTIRYIIKKSKKIVKKLFKNF